MTTRSDFRLWRLDVDGRLIIDTDWVATAIFVATSTAAAISPDTFTGAAVVVSLTLFALGCVAFLLAYATAIARSTTDAIGIGGLYFLAGSAPRRVQVSMLLALGVQTTAAFVTASVRIFTPLAFGILAPVFGLGMAGLWAARHGTFPGRTPRERVAGDDVSAG